MNMYSINQTNPHPRSKPFHVIKWAFPICILMGLLFSFGTMNVSFALPDPAPYVKYYTVWDLENKIGDPNHEIFYLKNRILADMREVYRVRYRVDDSVERVDHLRIDRHILVSYIYDAEGDQLLHRNSYLEVDGYDAFLEDNWDPASALAFPEYEDSNRNTINASNYDAATLENSSTPNNSVATAPEPAWVYHGWQLDYSYDAKNRPIVTRRTYYVNGIKLGWWTAEADRLVFYYKQGQEQLEFVFERNEEQQWVYKPTISSGGGQPMIPYPDAIETIPPFPDLDEPNPEAE